MDALSVALDPDVSHFSSTCISSEKIQVQWRVAVCGHWGTSHKKNISKMIGENSAKPLASSSKLPDPGAVPEGGHWQLPMLNSPQVAQ